MPEYDEQEKAELKIRQNKSIIEVLEDVYTAKKEQFGKPPEMKWGVQSIDNALWGIHKKRIYVVGARPSQGKSSFLIQTAWKLAKQDKRVVFVSLEMSSQTIFQRMISNELGLRDYGEKFKDSQDIMTARLLEHPYLFLVEIGGRTIAELQEIYRKYKPDVIIIDYIQNISPKGFKGKLEAIEAYITDCKELSIHYDTAIIIASQINRGGANVQGASVVDHMKGAGALEEAADALLHLQWVGNDDNAENPDDYKINLVKNRFGALKTFNLSYDPYLCRFADKEIHVIDQVPR